MCPSTVIAVDAMGGDTGPGPVLSGLGRALAADPDLRFLLHGPGAQLQPLLRRRTDLAAASEVVDAPDTVLMTDLPSRAVRERRESSMWRAIESVAAGRASVAVSCGNTGALLAMSVLGLRKAPGIDRPAIAVQWPSRLPQGFTIVLDVGADIRADRRNFVQFAVMGAEYARLGFGLARPRVGVLNVGTEPTKGTEELRAAAQAIAEMAAQPGAGFDAIGFVEGSDISGDRVDVVVTDGFTGNVALKTAEGTAGFIRGALRDAFRHSLISRLGSLFALTSLRRLGRRIDPRRVNGGVFLGLNGAVVKAHGGSDAVGVAAAIGLAAKMAATDFPGHVAAQLAKLEAGAESAPAMDEGTGRA